MSSELPPQYILTALFDDGKIPAHFNVVPWFKSERPGFQLGKLAARVCDQIPQFTVSGEEEIHIGRNGQTRSIRVGDSDYLLHQHVEASHQLVWPDRYVNPSHAGFGRYIPHVTPRGTMADFAVGSTAEVPKLALVTGSPEEFVVLEEFDLR